MCHVLVIEDDPVVANGLRLILAEVGATSVEIAGTQDDAVRAASRRRPALISSDYRLTEGTGADAVRLIRARYGPVPTVFLTSTPEAAATEGGPVRVLQKPVCRRRYEDAVRELLPPAG
jgi:two-component system, response regulator PdtaR